MKTLATILRNDSETERVSLLINENLELFCDNDKLEAPQFETEEEVLEYIKASWGGQVWGLELP